MILGIRQPNEKQAVRNVNFAQPDLILILHSRTEAVSSKRLLTSFFILI